jgi:hypothetical protein
VSPPTTVPFHVLPAWLVTETRFSASAWGNSLHLNVIVSDPNVRGAEASTRKLNSNVRIRPKCTSNCRRVWLTSDHAVSLEEPRPEGVYTGGRNPMQWQSTPMLIGHVISRRATLAVENRSL